MRVHVESDIYISGDGYGYTLERKRIGQEGKSAGQEFYTALGHYSSIQNCIQFGLLRMKIAESSATTLQELMAEVKRIEVEIKAAILI